MPDTDKSQEKENKLRAEIEGLQKKVNDLECVLGATNQIMYDLEPREKDKEVLAEMESLQNKVKDLESLLEATEAVVSELEPLRALEAKCQELEETVAALLEEKQVADEAIETYKLEWEMSKEELAICQEDLEAAQSQTAEQLEAMIAALPTGRAEIAKLNEQNRQLTDALCKLRDQSVDVQSRYDALKAETDRELEELRSKAIQVDKLEQELSVSKQAVGELQESMEDAIAFEEMVEKLSHKNTELMAFNQDLRNQIESLNEIIAANEEIEEGHVDLENQLQAELDSTKIELQEAHRQLLARQSELEDVNSVNRNFRSLVKDLENENQELLAAKSLSREDQLTGRANTKSLQSRLGEIQHRTIEYLFSKAEAREQNYSFEFLKSHMPDNVVFERASLDLINKVESLLFKSTLGAKVIHELYGAGSGKADQVSTKAYEICEKLMLVGQACNNLKFCLRVADEDTFDAMLMERESLNAADSEVNNLLRCVARDELTADTSLSGLNTSHENILGFVAAHLPDEEGPQNEQRRQMLARGPPVVNVEVQKLYLAQGSVSSKMHAVGDLLALASMRKNSGSENTQIPKYQQLFEQLEQLQQSNLELTGKMLSKAQAYEIVVSNSTDHDPKLFGEIFKTCSKFTVGSLLRLKDLYKWLETTIQGHLAKDYEVARQSQLWSQLNARFETECKEKRLLEELQSTRTALEDLSSKLDHGETPSTAGTFEPPVWEKRALDTRRELMQAASLKSSLEDATRRVESKAHELFATKKLVRDGQARIDVLTSKLMMLQNKLIEMEQMRQELEMYKKKDQDHTVGIEVVNQDLEKYSQANKTLRKQVLKLKYELKRQEESRPSDCSSASGAGVVTSTGKNLLSLEAAVAYINTMTETISLLRQQLAEVRAHHSVRELQSDLSPLPVVKSMRIQASGHHNGNLIQHVRCCHLLSFLWHTSIYSWMLVYSIFTSFL